jgi:hypothetical protein
MNFHLFVVIVTIIFYIVLRFYKYNVQQEKRFDKSKSNFIYILFVPAILYLTQFMYINKQQISQDGVTNEFDVTKNVMNSNVMSPVTKGPVTNIGDVSSESLLSAPFPESSTITF